MYASTLQIEKREFSSFTVTTNLSTQGHISSAKKPNIQQGALAELPVHSTESFDDILHYVQFNLVLKNSEEAFQVADSLYQNTTEPREQARALMLLAFISGKNSEPISALNHIDSALKLARENQINDILVFALYYKGELYRTWGFYNRGNAMLVEAQNLVPKIENDYLRDVFEITLIKGEAEMAIANYDFQKAKKLLLKITFDYKKWATTIPEAAVMLGRNYQLLGDCYYHLNDLDKAFETYHTANTHLNKWNTKNTIYTGRLYRALADIHLERNVLDSTKTYLLKALTIAEASNSNSFKNDVYKSLKKFYEKTNNSDHFTIYVKKQDSIESLINRQNNSMINAVAEYPILKKKDNPTSKEKAGTTEVQLIFIISLVFLSVTIYYSVKRHEKRKKLERAQEDNENSKRLLESNFNELIHLAKTNDPSFIAKFKQVYPTLYNKLTSLTENLTDSEIGLFAMVWLKFTSKEIAQFTFVQPKSVQIKKYRLRKKLSLPIGTDLYKWLDDLNKR